MSIKCIKDANLEETGFNYTMSLIQGKYKMFLCIISQTDCRLPLPCSLQTAWSIMPQKRQDPFPSGLSPRFLEQYC